VSAVLRTRLRGVGLWLGFAAFVAYVALPLYWVAISSFTSLADLFRSPPSFFPGQLTLHSYQRMVEALPFGSYLSNSLIFAFSSAIGSCVIAFFAAYAFARYRFRGRNALFAIFMLSAALPQIATVIPLFKLFSSLGMINTLHGLVILMASLALPFTIWILAAFIAQIPEEIEEAARIDGAGPLVVIVRIVAPLALPALATLFLINFILTWNELFYPLVFASGTGAKPLTLGLVELTTSSTGVAAGRPWDLLSALSIVMIIPPAVLVVVFQRWIVQGLTRGAVR
jgi:ABC-type glycerol-3-phosphate transport system permease component